MQGDDVYWARAVSAQEDALPFDVLGPVLARDLSAVRSGHHGSAESCTGKSENHKFFECLVHITPSLSFLRAFLAAYKKIGG